MQPMHHIEDNLSRRMLLIAATIIVVALWAILLPWWCLWGLIDAILSGKPTPIAYWLRHVVAPEFDHSSEIIAFKKIWKGPAHTHSEW